jgi:DNA-directed RNA polymerase specialized sigma24 family protein
MAKNLWVRRFIVRRVDVRAVEITNGDYRRLLRILTIRAHRFLNFASVAGTEPVLGESGASPEDFAIAALGKWLTGQLRFSGEPGRLPAFLMKVMTRDILDALKKRGVKLSRKGKTVPIDDLVEGPGSKSPREGLWDIRNLIREEAFMKLLRECTADDTDLQDFVYAVTEWEGEGGPAPREIADLLGVSTDEIQNRKRKLARRLIKQGVQLPTAGRR